MINIKCKTTTLIFMKLYGKCWAWTISPRTKMYLQ